MNGVPPILVRAAGALAILAGVMQGAAFFGGGLGFGERMLLLGWNLAQVPLALALWAILRSPRRRLVSVASVAGIASLVLWAGTAVETSLASLEAVWIGLSAAWWLGIGFAMRPLHRALALLTIATGLAAVGDALVTFPDMLGTPVPPALFMTVGGLKLPFALAWTIIVGLVLPVRPGSAPARTDPAVAAGGA